MRFRSPSSLTPRWRVIYLTIVSFLIGSFSFTFVLIQIAKWSARDAANTKWTTDGEALTVTLDQENKGAPTDLIVDFTSCQDRGALITILSDDSTLFLLCRSLDDLHSGLLLNQKGQMINFSQICNRRIIMTRLI
jgi:hypothetical protein